MEERPVSLIQEDVIDFLKKTPPFQFLDDGTLNAVASSMTMEFYPKGTAILTEGGRPSMFLSVIKKGGVKVSMASDDGGDHVLDYRGEGESFGFISVIGEDKARNTIVAVEDTLCYQVGRETVVGLLENNPSFTEYYLKSFFIKSIDRTYSEMRERRLLFGGGDRLLFSTPVGDIVTRKAVTRPRDISIREAAGVMSEGNISSLVLVEENGAPAGILTDRDLRSKVVAKGRDINGQASEIMSSSLVRVDARDYCFEALLTMVRYGIHHLLVVEDGELKGVVTNHDFMLLQGTSPVSIVREIESRRTVDELAVAAAKSGGIIALLLKEGVRAVNITRIISEINDRLVRRVIEIAEKRLGPPPMPYCWITFGSEGRKEQTFRTDQDNALIYADPATPEREAEAAIYFEALTTEVSASLVKLGFPSCPAGYMASNRTWRQPLRVWREYFRKWVYDPTPQAVLSSLIFFDFRPIHGDFLLAESLRGSLNAMVADQPVFLGFMANTIIRNMPPIGFFNRFVVEKGGEHKDELNLKVKGVSQFVDMVRLFALEKGVDDTSTLERLAALKDRHTLVSDYAEEIAAAFEFIMLLRVTHQMEQMEAGKTPDNFINPNRLTNLEKKSMKEAFHLASKLQDLIIERYKPMIF